MEKNKGFTLTIIIIIIVALLVVGGIAYYAIKSSTPAKNSNTDTQTNTN
ncbi:MAG: hypothetical protein JJE53_02490, partial [Candidatus Pacebacteria bacterium]|nr:hypothetical protein [Candidatus Paceibacterota bacterium]